MLKIFELKANVTSSWPANNLKYFFRNDKLCACMVKLLFKITLRTLLYEVIAARFGKSWQVAFHCFEKITFKVLIFHLALLSITTAQPIKLFITEKWLEIKIIFFSRKLILENNLKFMKTHFLKNGIPQFLPQHASICVKYHKAENMAQLFNHVT